MTNQKAKLDYELIDSGDGRKLERFGAFILDRPSLAAFWPKKCPAKIWKNANAFFERLNEKKGQWHSENALPESWVIEVEGLRFHLAPSPFGHLGIFPEQLATWKWLKKLCSKIKQPKVLNLFAYSGGSSLACAHAGAHVTHVDASRPMITWAKKNWDENKLKEAQVSWVLEDAVKFVKREVRRKKQYDGIILDPPSFGRGAKKEVFKLEKDLCVLLEHIQPLLKQPSSFMHLSCHTPGVSPLSLKIMAERTINHKNRNWDFGEMILGDPVTGPSLPSGIYTKIENI